MKALALKIKHTIWVSPFCLAVFLSPLKSQAVTIQEVPNPRQVNGGWVTDTAGMLDETTEAKLNSLISELEVKNGAEMAVVTVPETAPSASPKEFATALFNYWGIGKKGKDNGILFLISKSDRRVEIETGYGIEPILPDAKVGNIINTQIIPRFKQSDFNGGTLAGTKALVAALEAPPSSASKKPTTTATASATQENSVAEPSTSLSEEPTQNSDVPWWLFAGGGGVAAIATAVSRSRRVFVKPEGRTRLRGSDHPIHCADCKKRMEKVEKSAIHSQLSQAEKVAQNLGSVRFESWKCPNCSQQQTGLGYHIVAWVSNSDRFIECPNCHEWTATRTKKVVKKATQYSSGKRLIIDECHCCSYDKEWEETIPRLPPPSSSTGGGGYSGGSSTGGGSYSGGCSTGGGSTGGGFGGGSSGGGGAGGGW